MKSFLAQVLVSVLFIVLVFNSQAAFARNFENKGKLISASKQSGVTMASFKRIKVGMTVQAVNRIIGFQGEVIYSERDVNGRLHEAVKWEGSNYRVITASFSGNRLTKKFQANL